MNKKTLLALVLSLFLLLPTQGCSSFRPGWVSENSFEVSEDITDEDFDGPLNGSFNEAGEWVPNDKTIEWTYRIPDISAGFVFDIPRLEATPSLQIEIIEFDLSFLPYLSTWKFDFGVAHNRTFGYIGPRITSIFEISVGGFCGWNWKERELTYGLGFTIIKF